MSEEKMVMIDGRKVFYFERGDKTQPALVLLHGYPGNYEGLLDVAHTLGNHWRIIIPNFPSCGGSEALAGKHNLEKFGQWLYDFLQHLSVENPVIIGHSFGSRVALTFAVKNPQKIRGLVLITPVLKADSVLVYVVLLKYKIAKLLPLRAQKAFLSSKFYEYMACKIVLKSKNPARQRKIIDRGFKELQHVNPDAQIDLFEEFYQSDLTVLGKKIMVPLLVIAGQKDEVATLRSMRALMATTKNAVLKIMKNSGHLVPFEKPVAIANSINEWLIHL
jgi:pimeloyl-ACP methyl ester carboxylesterase